MIRIGWFLLLLLPVATPSAAALPDPLLSNVPNVIGVPGGGMWYHVDIASDDGPTQGATVALLWTPAADSATCWCSGQVHPAVSSVTDAEGRASFNLSLGGCLNPGGVLVFVNGILFKEVGQVSPDVVSTPTPCNVAIGDAVSYTSSLATSTYSFCHDLNSDLAVGLIDAVAVTKYLATARTCP